MSERDDAERRLTGLGAAYDRIATAMYTVDTHPGWSRLDRGLVTGQTGVVRSALRPEVDQLWASFTALGESLEAARGLLARPRFGGSVAPELTTLLTGQPIGLDTNGLPTDSTTPAVTHISLADLAERTERRSSAVLSQLSDVDTSASAVAASYVEISAEVDAVAALAAQVGEADVAVPLRAAAGEVERLDLADPLTAAPGGRLTGAALGRLERLRAAIAQARERLNELASVRDGYADRRAALAAAVAEIDQAEQAVAAAFERARAKIADPGLSPVPASATVLRSRLADLDALRDRARADGTQWRRLVADMSTVETAVQRARAVAAEQRELADGLVARRDELRGRLDAYRAKGVARGLAEEGRLAELYIRAHELLYTAPCDLRAATRAVHAYQTSLVDLSDRGELARRAERQPGPAAGERFSADERSTVDD